MQNLGGKQSALWQDYGELQNREYKHQSNPTPRPETDLNQCSDSKLTNSANPRKRTKC